MFLKEIETMKNFTKSIEKRFQEIKNFINSLSVNNHRLGTPEKEKRVFVSCGIITRVTRVSALEKQLAEKGAIIDFLLNQKVQNEIDSTTFISKASNSDMQRYKKPNKFQHKKFE